jgi:hypothetical protein
MFIYNILLTDDDRERRGVDLVCGLWFG